MKTSPEEDEDLRTLRADLVRIVLDELRSAPAMEVPLTLTNEQIAGLAKDTEMKLNAALDEITRKLDDHKAAVGTLLAQHVASVEAKLAKASTGSGSVGGTKIVGDELTVLNGNIFQILKILGDAREDFSFNRGEAGSIAGDEIDDDIQQRGKGFDEKTKESISWLYRSSIGKPLLAIIVIVVFLALIKFALDAGAARHEPVQRAETVQTLPVPKRSSEVIFGPDPNVRDETGPSADANE